MIFKKRRLHSEHCVLFFIVYLTLRKGSGGIKVLTQISAPQMVHSSPCRIRCPDIYKYLSQWCSILSIQVHQANIYHLPLWKGGHPNPGLPFRKCLPSLSSMPSGPIEGCRWKGGPRGGKGIGILNLSGGNMGPPGIICGGICGMFGGGRNGGR